MTEISSDSHVTAHRIPAASLPENAGGSSIIAAAEAQRAATSTRKAPARKQLLIGLGVIILLGALLYGAYWYVYLSTFESTDNAYVSAEVAQVTPLVSGPVRSIAATDTDTVTKGQILVQLDNSDAQIAVDQAEAELERARRRVEGYVANNDALQAQVAAREADQQRAIADVSALQASFDRAKIDYDRRKALLRSGAVSADEVTSAEQILATGTANLTAAQAAITVAASMKDAAEGALRINKILTSGTSIDTNPEIVSAQATLNKARLDLDRDVIRAPVDGIVAQREVQIGQHVGIGTVLMTVVPIDQTYVDANFKESQLTHVRAGQKATLTSDLYGSSVVYHGIVSGLAGGTGAAFSIIPAQNATGNWIKVVQRVPVRISLDPKELAAHPLRVGLSMNATIDTASRPAS